MKKTLSALLSLILILSPVRPVFADDSLYGMCGSGIEWSFDGKALRVSGSGEMFDYSDASPAPWYAFAEEVSALEVSDGITRIGSDAFRCLGAVKVSLPSSVTELGDRSFSECSSLTSFSAKKGLVSVGYETFSGCYALKTVSLPSSVKYLGDYCFGGCSSLSSFAFPDKLVSVGKYSFVGCSSLASVSLPPFSVISEGSFEGCTSLSEVTLPRYMKDVPDYSFFGCYSLHSVKFGGYTERIGEEAFLLCENYSSARLPSSVSEIGAHALGYSYFDGEYIPYPDFSVASVGGAGAVYASDNGFKHIYDSDDHICSHICPFCERCTDPDCICLNCAEKCEGHTFPISGTCGEGLRWELYESGEMYVTGQGGMTDFSYDGVPWNKSASAVKSVNIGDGVTSVGSYAFSECENLKTAYIGSSVTEIGHKAFFRSGLEKLSAEGVRSVGRLAFAFTALSEVSLPSCKVIDGYAFDGCASLKAITLNNIERIGDNAFESCPVETAKLPSSSVSVGDCAFGYRFTENRVLEKTTEPTLVITERVTGSDEVSAESSPTVSSSPSVRSEENADASAGAVPVTPRTAAKRILRAVTDRAASQRHPLTGNMLSEGRKIKNAELLKIVNIIKAVMMFFA